MAATVSNVAIPDSLLQAAEIQARLRGVSLEQWVSKAVASHLDGNESAREFFRRRAEGAESGSIKRWLDSRPSVSPIAGDEVE